MTMATAEGRKVRMPGRKARLSHFSTFSMGLSCLLMTVRSYLYSMRGFGCRHCSSGSASCMPGISRATGLASGIAGEVSEDLPFLDLEFAGLAALVLPCLTQ